MGTSGIGGGIHIGSSHHHVNKLESDVADVEAGLLEGVGAGGGVCGGVSVSGVLDMRGVLRDCAPTS